MKIFIIALLLSVLSANLYGQSKKRESKLISKSINNHVIKNNQQFCTSVIDGLKFCIATPLVSVKSGQSVPVVITVYNLTFKDIFLQNDYFDNSYDVSVMNSKAQNILSFKEKIRLNNQAKSVVSEEMIKTLPINPPHQPIKIAANDKIDATFNLGYFYDFSELGKYSVTIRKKLMKSNSNNNNLLGKIEVNIN